MIDSTAATSPRWQYWPSPKSRVARIGLWLSAGVVVCSILWLLSGHGAASAFFMGWGIFLFSLELPFLLILLLRFLNRRLLWKVRNRLILTYLLMGLAPVVLFGTLTAIAGYILAGQYAINTALASLDEASGQLKSQSASLADIYTSQEFQNDGKPLKFEESSNPREADIGLAILHNGVLANLPIVTRRGATPASPFMGQPKPVWLKEDYHGVIVANGKLYLAYDGRTQEEKRSAEVLATLELNHGTLNTMSKSLGRVLLFSGFNNLHANRIESTDRIESAEKEAQTAENEAEAAQRAQEAERDRQEQARDAQQNLKQQRRDEQEQASETQRDAQEQMRDAQQEISKAQRDAQQKMRDAQRELDEAHREAQRAQARGSQEDENETRQSLQEAEQSLKQAQDEAQQEIQQALKEAPKPALPSQSLPPQPAIPRPSPIAPSYKLAPQLRVRIATGKIPTGTTTAAAFQSAPNFTAVSGGVLPAAAHFFDPQIYFTAPLPFVAWPGDTQNHSAMLVVISRPSVLYTRLFSTSVDIGSMLRNLLVAIAIFFGLLELLALWMATRLSRTITRSVAGLYAGTTEIDKGNLDYRVKPDRQDQLGALANSFNTMAGSIQDLLVQQREKERLLSELAIAQEVQRNLFPHSPAFVTGLELHAVCEPARSVSGDYFDFIFGGSATSRGGTTTCIALGDISGKGISAALLMASLHSAVRAFSLGEEDVASPARLLDLLNRHLFRSTTPEKYATLFIAFYDAATRRLTYANGGHLPPLILAADGRVQRLEVGGSVVGLLDGLVYGEATIKLEPGDLLVAYSDGLTEPERETVEFGEDRLLAFLLEHRGDPLPAITEATFRTLKGWIGDHEQPDDMTLLLARQL